MAATFTFKHTVCCSFAEGVDVALPFVAFDLDHTLIRPFAGAFPKDAHDWVYIDGVVQKLRSLAGIRNFVIFTNQLGVSKKKVNIRMIIDRIKLFLDDAGIRADVLISTEDDTYRKPHILMMTMWKKERKEAKIEMYIGDAAGRQGDFSCDDRKFAYNCEIPFATPEEYFTGAVAAPYTMSDRELDFFGTLM